MVPETAKPKVLFIDDDPVMHALYKPHIESAGYEVVDLVEASQAVQTATSEQPQVIVIDMIMPGIDGLETILALKAAESTKHMPIIAISGEQTYHGLRQELQRAGADAFLSKPFGAAKLVSEIRRWD